MAIMLDQESATSIDLERGSEDLLAALDKDPRLVPYGGGNFGMPLALMEPEGGLTVPTERFFLRSNGPVPRIDPRRWELRLSGHVDRDLVLRLDDLRAMPWRTITAFLECAGNGRTRFDPVPGGTPWVNDAVGNAVWGGVPLRHLLALASVGEGAVDVVSQGGDFLEMRRGLPLAAASDPDTLVVLEMNGNLLTAAHGGPARLLVPGWAGIASTKWLVGLEVIDHAFVGFWNSDNYVYWSEDGTPLRPVTEMPVKSIISSPADGAMLATGPVTVAGYAWSGHGAIDRVEVSVDGGGCWEPARLVGTGRRSWVRFERTWSAGPGRHRLMARAVDERGLRQPARAAWNARGYGQNSIPEVGVTMQDTLAENGVEPRRNGRMHPQRMEESR
jgi:DMSO/TMAO reductase YedYZ molybdopterin-dependent catalytic subunit